VATSDAVLAYPTDHVLGVIDDREAAPRVLAALQQVGVDPADARILTDPSTDDLGSLGHRPGLATRVLGLIRFATMDQAPDLRVYEAAIVDGRAVVAVHVSDRAQVVRSRTALEAAGAHFLNYYGRFTTEELVRWRGPELDLPGWLRR
jgi:hypothetical protein